MAGALTDLGAATISGTLSNSAASSICGELARSPILTLFPYTTLFRSTTQTGFPHLGNFNTANSQVTLTLNGNSSVQDRKSTRLNSSHVANSYVAVCLKTKITSWDGNAGNSLLNESNGTVSYTGSTAGS